MRPQEAGEKNAEPRNFKIVVLTALSKRATPFVTGHISMKVVGF
jgi:hypothetical protein